MVGWLFFVIIVLYFFDTIRVLSKMERYFSVEHRKFKEFSVLQRWLPSPWVICFLAIIILVAAHYWSLSWALGTSATIIWSLVFGIIGFYSHVILWVGFTEQQFPQS